MILSGPQVCERLRVFLIIRPMISISSLSNELREQVVHAMQSGESPVWIAQPIPSMANQLSTPYLFFSVFGVFFSALVYIVAGLLNIYMLFSLLFTGVAVGMVFIIRRRMKRTVYILTEQRAIVLRPTGVTKKGGWQLIAWPLIAGLVKERVLRNDGSGDLIFGYEPKKSSEDTTVPMGFFNLPELRRVEQMLMDITPSSRN
ncbi:MAG: hypothetical protein II295_08160 [Akkermansia sp.]|nr:hypothetical protein [Akkermansia sp.]